MSKELQIFENKYFGSVRVLIIDGEPWFVAKDVADILTYNQTNHMLQLIDKRDYQEIDPQNQSYQGFPQNTGTQILEPNKNIRRMVLINESGLYSAILNSTLPKAKEFKRWVTSEVLPSIRKTGFYALPNLKTPEDFRNFFDANMIRKICDKWEEATVECERLTAINASQEELIKELKPKADYCDQIVADKEFFPVTVIAKNFGMSAKSFNQLLRSFRIQYPVKGYWVLYQAYAGKGYALTLKEPINGHQVTTMYWTPKGLKFIYEFLADQGILPLNIQ